MLVILVKEIFVFKLVVEKKVLVLMKEIELYFVVNGKVIFIFEVLDDVFLVKMMGDGFVVVLIDGEVLIFVVGKIISIFLIKYVLGI